MGAEPGIPREDERPPREPEEDESKPAARQSGRGPVADALRLADLGRAVQVHQDGQRPAAGGERERHQGGQHHPRVPVPPGRIGVRRPDGVPVPPLAVHLRPGVAVRRVVPGQIGRAVRDEAVEQEPGEGAPALQPGPLGRGQHPAVTGVVPRGQLADRPEQVGDGSPAGGEDGGGREDDEPGVGRLSEVREEGREQRLSLGGEEHGGRPWAAKSGRSRPHATRGTIKETAQVELQVVCAVLVSASDGGHAMCGPRRPSSPPDAALRH